MLNLIKGDICFQMKYGFYFVYTIFTIFYIVLLFAFPEAAREKTTIILIYTDPAAMGLFFMGAIVLLEKSQRVLDTIAVSPVKVSEYIISKTVSLGLIATIVGVLIALSAGNRNILEVAAGTFLGSLFFSLIGLMIASKISSLNQFMVASIPFELACFLPPLFYLFGYKESFMLLHPGCIIIRMLSGDNAFLPIPLLILTVWILLMYLLSYRTVKKMFTSIGGVKL
jgi:fluoroquinolone transport system permease protein